MRDAEAIYGVGFEQLADVPFGTLVDMLKALPAMARLRADRSVYGLAARHVRDERLRTALSFHPLFIGGNPFATTAIYALVIHLERKFGVHFAQGGTGALVAGLVKLLEGQGATLRYGAEVAQITVANGAATGVRLADGQAIAADVVVSNADAAYTYGTLLKAQPRKRWSDAKLKRAQLFDVGRGLVFRHAAAATTASPTTASCLAHAIAGWSRTSSSGRCCRRISASICIARRRPILPSRPRAATPSMRSCRCPISRAAPTGRRRPSLSGPASSSGSRRPFCRGSAAASSARG